MKWNFLLKIKLNNYFKKYQNLFSHQKQDTKYFVEKQGVWSNPVYVVGEFKFTYLPFYFKVEHKENSIGTFDERGFTPNMNITDELFEKMVKSFVILIEDMEGVVYP